MLSCKWTTKRLHFDLQPVARHRTSIAASFPSRGNIQWTLAAIRLVMILGCRLADLLQIQSLLLVKAEGASFTQTDAYCRHYSWGLIDTAVGKNIMS